MILMLHTNSIIKQKSFNSINTYIIDNIGIDTL